MGVQVVERVDLSRLRLHTRHVPEVRRFHHLRVLNLAHNKLSTLVELNLRHLVALEQLDLHNNTLS
jgi:Leucine-rich repeat (LRR) protein